MCDKCAKTLRGLVKPHVAATCPLVKGLYCGMCAVYGHSQANCPDVDAAYYRSPQFMEQLIPPSLLEEYGIKTRTSLVPLPPVEPTIPPMYIPDTQESIRAALISMDVKPKLCHAKNAAEEIQVNKGKLAELGREIIYVDPDAVIPPYAPVKKWILKKRV
jgi:hypothetical protein